MDSASHAYRPPYCVVIGAGVAGLALALRLGEHGGRSLLLEAEDRPGGLAKSLHFKGISSDLGPHRIHTEIPEVMRLIEQVAAPSLFTVRRTSHIYLRGKFLKYPPSAFELARHLGPAAMARFAASYATEKLKRRREPETYESLMCGAFGRELYDFLLRPYSAKTWKIDPAELHADTARVRVSAGSLAKMLGSLFKRGERSGGETALKQFRYVRGGAETLVRHLWEHAASFNAQLRVNARVNSLRLNGDQSRIAAALLDGGQEQLTGDAFVSTIPLPLLVSDALPPIDTLAAAREAAAGLHYLDIIFALIIVRRKIISGDNWLYFPEPHLIFNRAYEAKNFDPSMGAEDRSVLCLEITHRRNEPPGTSSDDELRVRVLADITSTGLFRRDEVEEVILYRVGWAYPVYTLDYDRRLDKTFSGLRKISNLITLGRQGLFNHNNMDHSIWMGLRAADLLGRLPLSDAVQTWYDRVGEYKHLRIVD